MFIAINNALILSSLPHPIGHNAIALIGGFSLVQPRSISGVVFNIGRDGWEETEACRAALAALLQAGRVVQAPGKADGWYLRAA